jgi:hypothetical protein
MSFFFFSKALSQDIHQDDNWKPCFQMFTCKKPLLHCSLKKDTPLTHLTILVFLVCYFFWFYRELTPLQITYSRKKYYIHNISENHYFSRICTTCSASPYEGQTAMRIAKHKSSGRTHLLLHLEPFLYSSIISIPAMIIVQQYTKQNLILLASKNRKFRYRKN